MIESTKYLLNIYCCGCESKVSAELITGKEVYPHRKDLYSLNFWKCPTCKNFVGTHKGTNKPLGVIATQSIKNSRMRIHAILDPLWKNEKLTRSQVYSRMADKLGKQYHTAELKSLEECEQAIEAALSIKSDVSVMA